ncbi:FAD-dependent oxidoreductase [Cupriavidus sp. IDO]|uniref:FAD-dependent oxidoreductase n=1 Tax=Cupriavidus sp. IDO TaxID=1539142 RepID=UPI0005796E45|nr:cyclic nucleotide-binding domain-containing thioredoxin-disulfide reductase [Cupriavidus sp. IDO]KWR84605.1 copper transporter [Cupriavidus sp. IDO]
MDASDKGDKKPGDDRWGQRFPVLTEGQITRILRYGTVQRFPSGYVLFRQGDRNIPTYVVLSGSLQVERGNVIDSRSLGQRGPGMFTGDVGSLVGRAAVATVRVETDSELLVIDPEGIRTLVISEADLSEIIMRAFILRRVAFIEDEASGGVVVIASKQTAGALSLREFLSRNSYPALCLDTDRHPEAHTLMERFHIAPDDLPAVITPKAEVLRRPTIRALADAVGLSPGPLQGRRFDLAVVGAGPAGLAAAVYGASEGLRSVVLDATAPGGQAGTSSKIENYFGFPTGISGRALAGRGLAQSRKFGVEVAVPVSVTALRTKDREFVLEMDNGECIEARAVVIATGARYRKPDLVNLGDYEGRGIYYNASFTEATYCGGEEVIVVGGGNSAGQAAVFLSEHARHVHMLVRSRGLAASMSHYLIQRINASPNITLHAETEIKALLGQGRLEAVQCSDTRGAIRTFDIAHVFLFLGAEPCTGWLGGCVALDDKAFVLTGTHVPMDRWKLGRPVFPMETSLPGVFAVGDVRSGSVKRVAAAVGEGAAAVQALHQYFA